MFPLTYVIVTRLPKQPNVTKTNNYFHPSQCIPIRFIIGKYKTYIMIKMEKYIEDNWSDQFYSND